LHPYQVIAHLSGRQERMPVTLEDEILQKKTFFVKYTCFPLCDY
jgi:hypothetical protein